MNKKVEVSILLAVYNGGEYFHEAIDSVLNQDFENWELVIVENGNSTDSTKEVMQKYADLDDRVKVFSLPEKGKNKAYNLAFEKSSGEWICFFAADDILPETNLSQRRNAVKSPNQYATCRLQTFSDDQKLDGLVFPKKQDIPNYSGGSLFFSREHAEDVFPLPLGLPNEDVWTSLLLQVKGENKHLNDPLYLYRMHDHNSFGYNLSYQEKRDKFLIRMSAYTLFIEKWQENLDQFDYYADIKRFANALEKFNEGSYFKVLTSDIKLTRKLKLMVYAHPFLYRLRNLLFRYLSGVLN